MQWLIDLIIEAIGIPPTYINRDDPVAMDFDKADLNLDGNLHPLDLSGIVPANASAVHIFMSIVTPGVGTCFWLYPNDCVNCLSALGVTSQVAAIEIDCDGPVAIGPDGLIKYAGFAALFNAITIHVRGWWL